MMSIPRVVAAVLAASIGLGVAIAPSAAGASTRSPRLVAEQLGGSPGVGTGAVVAGAGGSAAGTCGLSEGPHGQGATGGTDNQVCEGAGTAFVAPSVGQASSVVGPNISGSTQIGTQVTSAGDVMAG